MKRIVILLSLFVFTQLNAADYYVKFKAEFFAQHKDELAVSFQKEIGTTHSITKLQQIAPSIFSNGLNRVFFLSAKNVDIEFLQKVSSVEFAEVAPVYETSATPNDPQLSSQWHLATINAFNAWNVSTGSATAKVAIVDNAVMRNHQDLAANIYTNPGEIAGNNLDDDGNGYIDDVQGWDAADNDNNPNPPNPTFSHGTHCAGIASAVTNNNLGIASIGYGCKIIPVKSTGDNSSPNTITNSAAGVAYAIASGANVVSMSFGGGGYSSFMQQLFDAGFQQGIVFVAAAGNNNSSQIHYPAGYNHVISVAATNPSDQKASFSNYGTWVDISAPGTNIYSTIPNTTTGTYGNMSGTSMACPLVAGLCVLMKAHTPSLTPTQLETCLQQSADNISALNPSYLGQLGAGRINALAALNCQACNAVASFTSTNNLISYPKNSNVCFTANGTGNSFNWSINGTSYSGNSTCNTFSTAGYYNVCNYAVGNFAGCADTLCKSFTIYDTTGITVCAPRYGNKWIFGTGNLLDFSSDPPLSSGGISFTAGNEAASSLSDVCGNLLAYTNGVTIFDRGNQAMPNGSGLTGNVSTTDGAIFVPMPGVRNKYYLITLTDISQTASTNGCYYHVVDMTLPGNGTVSNPKGNVLLKNQPIQTLASQNCALSEKMEVIRHANGIDFWLVLHNNFSNSYPSPFNKFFVYRISSGGISGPDIYSVGTAFTTNVHGIGDMKANTAGNKIAISCIDQYVGNIGFVQLFDFNKSTGVISNPVNAATGIFNNYSLAFSPNDQNLFYDLTNTSFVNGEIKMYRISTGITSTVVTGMAHVPMGMQLGPDGKIYIVNIITATGSFPSASAMSTINNPDASVATAVNYLYENVGLPTAGAHNLPIFVKSDLFSIPPQVSANDTICVSDTSQFDVDVEICAGLDGILTYAWNFNDAASGASNTSNLKSPKHKFTAPGLYQVKIVASAACYHDSISIPVLVRNCQSTPDPVTFNPLVDSVNCPTPDSISVNIGGGKYYRVSINGSLQPFRYLDMPAGTYTTVNIPVGNNTPPLNICAVFYDDTTWTATDTVCAIVTGSGNATPPSLVDTSVCAGANVLLNAGNNWTTYHWSNGAPTATTTVNTAGTYFVTVTNAGGCSATADVVVSQTNLQLTISTVSTNCGLNNGVAIVSPTTGNAPFTFLWSNSSNNDTITNLAAGNYPVTVHDANGCSSTATAVVNPSGAGSVVAQSDKAIMCAGDSSLICVPSGYAAYLWSNGKTDSCIYAKTAGNYYVTVTDVGNCTASSNHVNIAVYPLPGVSISVNGDTLTAYGAINYQWYFNYVLIPNATSSVYVATVTGNYTVEVTDSNGCKASSNKVTITTGIEFLSSSSAIKIYPNPLSNGNWQIEVADDFIGSELQIFDAEGRLVYQSHLTTNHSSLDFTAARGIYLAKIVSERVVFTGRLVKL